MSKFIHGVLEYKGKYFCANCEKMLEGKNDICEDCLQARIDDGHKAFRVFMCRECQKEARISQGESWEK